jgi:uncharacterized protein (TIGR03437 family)
MVRAMMWLGALSAFVAPLSPAGGTLALSADGLTVYDSSNNITWLAVADLPASNRFGIPLCTGSANQTCINANGSMNYPAAVAWVSAMNGANYLGHNNWQLPTTPMTDSGCTKTGPNGSSFAYGCTANALGSLYYNGLGLKAPNTAVPIPSAATGPFSNLQPYLYWSQTSSGGNGSATFSFDTGWQGSNTLTHVMYVFPMIRGKLAGTPAAPGQGLQVNPGGQTVYDPVSNVTWAANANLAATNSFGLPACQNATTPAICVNADGGLNLDSANQFIANMNAFNGTGYLGQKNWELPPVDDHCSGWNCGGSQSPMGELFYNQFGLGQGMSAVATPDIAVGPFHSLQPYLYWSCLAAKIQSACESDEPVQNQEFSFSFGNGFEGTDILPNNLFVTAYFVGARNSTTGPVVAEVANAEGESPAIAPNTWVEIKGVNLAPAGDSRPWQASDFTGNNMPTQLDKVGVTVNGKSAYVYYISSSQINILTPPDALPGTAQVTVTNNAVTSAAFTAQAQALSPSFFVFGGGPYIAAVHANGSLIGPPALYPGATTPAKPGETVLIYANGFGPTSVPVVAGSIMQSGTLSPLPTIQIGGVPAPVQFAGLVAPGEFQFNVVIPTGLGNGDQPITATYAGASTQVGALITLHN